MCCNINTVTGLTLRLLNNTYAFYRVANYLQLFAYVDNKT